MSAFGDRLRHLRQLADLTQARVAQEIGVSDAYISALESGRKPAPPRALVDAIEYSVHARKNELWELARKEREARLADRINGSPAALRIRHYPSATSQPVGPADVSTPSRETEPRDTGDASLENAVQAIKEAVQDQGAKQQIIALLEAVVGELKGEDE